MTYGITKTSKYHSLIRFIKVAKVSAKTWDIVPPEAKQINSLKGFKRSIGKWIQTD